MISYALHILYAALVSSSILMFFALSPVNAILFLISVFFTTSMIFMVSGVDFLGILILLVYVGAVAVLFLFIVMMLNVRRIERDTTMYLILGCFIAFLLLCQFQYLGFKTNILYSQLHLPTQFNSFSYFVCICLDEAQRATSVSYLGILLFSEFSILLLLAAVLLLVAMVGAICLTNNKRGFLIRLQYDQLRRTNETLAFQNY